MKTKLLLASVLLLTTVLAWQTGDAQSVSPQAAVYQQKVQSVALLFMENKGQIADEKGNLQPDILFSANSGGAKVYLTATGIHYQFSRTDYPKGYDLSPKHLQKDEKQQEELRKQIKTSTHRFTVELQGANLQPTVTKQGQSDYTENYYLAQCLNGIIGVHGFEKITFKNVYPNIDWVVYSKGGFMEYDFLVHPGGNPANIKLKIKDADAVSITPQGELLMKTRLGEVKEKAPVSYAGGDIVASRFKQNSDGTIGFDVQVQAGKELRIDPSIVWSTYYGGSGRDSPTSCAVDRNGNFFAVGVTSSRSGIALNGFKDTIDAVNYSYDYFVAKVNNNGTLLWATYYGGNGNEEYRTHCAVDSTGNVYLASTTTSQGLAYNGFKDSVTGFESAILVKFSSTGSRLWATYYGGNNETDGFSCTTDKLGNVYLVGYTNSTTNISSNGFQNTLAGQQDAFLVKFTGAGSRLWATYYGGASFDLLTSCIVDSAQNVFCSGYTYSVSGIAYNGFQNSFGGGTNSDMFIVKFSSTGSRLWATYWGGTGTEYGENSALDSNGNFYLNCTTTSLSNIAFSGFQNAYGGGMSDGALIKVNSSGIKLWSTYYGGSQWDEGQSCATYKGFVYLTGYTESSNNISAGGFNSTYQGNYDGYLVKFDTLGRRIWATYLGRNNATFDMAIDSAERIFLCDNTSLTSGLYGGGFQNIYGGGTSDGIFVKIDGSKSFTALCPNGVVSITSPITGSTYQWEFSQDGTTWVNVAGTTAQTLSLANLPSTFYGYQYRCRVNGATYTDPYQLKFENRWIGTTNNAWENPANWSCGVLPDGNTDVIINSSSVVLNSNGICRTLTVRPGVSFTVTTGNTLTITH